MKLLLFILLITSISCAFEETTRGPTSAEEDQEDTQMVEGYDDMVAIVTFQELQNEVLIPHCIRCHSNWAGDEEQVLARVVPGKPEESSLYQLIDSGRMPMGAPELDDVKKRIVFDYINDLIDSDNDTDSPSDDSNSEDPVNEEEPVQVVAIETIKERILIPKCSACHGSWVNDDAQILSRVVAEDPASSPLYIITENGSMPMSGPPLSEAELDLMREFIINL